jgi:hypothetical protein
MRNYLKLKNKMKKIVLERKKVFSTFELLTNQDETSEYLSTHQKEVLRRRKELIVGISDLKDRLKKLDADLIYDNALLSVTDTPQGTQFIRKLEGQKIIKFHYVI